MTPQNDQKPTREEMLRRYAKKPMKRFLQITGVSQLSGPIGRTLHFLGRHSALGNPDTATALFTEGYHYELRNKGGDSIPLILLINEEAYKEDVVALLREAAAWLENDWDTLTTPDTSERIEQQTQEQDDSF